MRRMTSNGARVMCSGVLVLMAAGAASASSHREAPFVTENPKVDGTDFYMFNSYEPGRDGFVTLVANYLPLQDAYGGPNYFALDPNAQYDINIDNDGDALPDIIFRFQATNTLKDLTVDVGGIPVSVPLINIGGVGPGRDDTTFLNVVETYKAWIVRPAAGTREPIRDAASGDVTFKKPVDNVGNKSLADYASYAADHVYDINIPGCSQQGRLFVGQRKDPFVVNLGETFDLVNTDPVGPPDAELDSLAYKNVTSFILEVPASCLTNGSESVVGGWTTASLRMKRTLTETPTFDQPAMERGEYVQVSRLGMPLVNELVIGIKDKDLFNASQPVDDGQFALYVTNPTLPVLLNVLFGVTPPCLPRNDLVTVFLTGVPGVNQPAGVVASEMLRLNTNTDPDNGGIAVTPKGSQSSLGVLGGDLSGYPNGRRPGDDVVDISLRVVMGVLYSDAGDPNGCAPSGLLPLTDGATISDQNFSDGFPYLLDPVPGSPSN